MKPVVPRLKRNNASTPESLLQQPSGRIKEQMPRSHTLSTNYRYTTGASQLSMRAPEHILLAERIASDWRTTEGFAASPPAICDYGTGDGTLTDLILSLLSPVKPADISADLVELDSQLLSRARLKLAKSAGAITTISPAEFYKSSTRYSHILASHVLYYVDDRGGLVDELIRHLRPNGILSIVLRSETCDTYLIRSRIREASKTADLRPRITTALVKQWLTGAQLDLTTTTIKFHLDLRIDEADLRGLVQREVHSPIVELLRFIGHVHPDDHDFGTPELLNFILERTTRHICRFQFSSDILSARLSFPPWSPDR